MLVVVQKPHTGLCVDTHLVQYIIIFNVVKVVQKIQNAWVSCQFESHRLEFLYKLGALMQLPKQVKVDIVVWQKDTVPLIHEGELSKEQCDVGEDR